MQVTETLAEGLRREYQIVVPATELETKVNARLEELKSQVRINGFRPGKVPVAHLKRLYGRSAMAEAIEGAVRDGNAKIVAEGGFKLAMEPKVTLPTEQALIENVIAGKTDLSYTVALEILPKIELADFKGLKLEKLVADVSDDEIDAAVKQIGEQNRPFGAKPEGATAQKGDRLTISYTGTIDGKPFEGGTGDDVVVEIGAGGFLPG